MKRFLLAAAALFVFATVAFAGNTIKEISVAVSLQEDGSAVVQEHWDVVAESGTELYVAREDLREMRFMDFAVRDENGKYLDNIGKWNINASRAEKAGKFGINETASGFELCWGFGEYGSHSFDLFYRITNVTEALTDYDYYHFQIIPEDLAPRDIRIEISAPQPLSEDNTRIWGFRFQGNIDFENGKVVATNSQPLKPENSAVVLLRFEKGIFSPMIERNYGFDEIQERAMDGAKYESRGDRLFDFFGVLFTMVTMFFIFLVPFLFNSNANNRRKRKKLFLMKDSEVPWNRDIPFGANILESDVVSKDLGLNGQKGNIASAIILRFIYDGVLIAQKDEKDNVIFLFNRGDVLTDDGYSKTEIKLYSLLYQASGEDHILQHKEFSKWAGRHQQSFYNWSNDIDSDGKSHLRADEFANVRIWGSGLQYTDTGRIEALKLFGFKKFLQEYTLIKERSTPEVGLWQNYMIFGALFGIADKVASELKEINPALYEQMLPSGNVSTITPYDTWYFSNMISRNIENARMAQQMAQARSARAAGGFGGMTSMGGGGGFSGGGHGGFR